MVDSPPCLIFSYGQGSLGCHLDSEGAAREYADTLGAARAFTGILNPGPVLDQNIGPESERLEMGAKSRRLVRRTPREEQIRLVPARPEIDGLGCSVGERQHDGNWNVGSRCPWNVNRQLQVWGVGQDVHGTGFEQGHRPTTPSIFRVNFRNMDSNRFPLERFQYFFDVRRDDEGAEEVPFPAINFVLSPEYSGSKHFRCGNPSRHGERCKCK